MDIIKIARLTLPLLAVTISSCATIKTQEKTPLTKPSVPQQSPSVLHQQQKPEACSSANINQVMNKEGLLEAAFLAQNCDEVLEHARLLEKAYPEIIFAKAPPFVQAAIYTCNGKAGLNDSARVKESITNLKKLSLRYPFINEAWLHNTLADFYIAINDKQNAINEKKTARDLLLAQQQDVSSLNVEIMKLDPSNQTVVPSNQTSGGSAAPVGTLSLDQIVTSATQLINNDSPDQAIALLDTVPQTQRSESIKRLRLEAMNNLVMNLRFKVRALFIRATEQTGQARKDSLQQCEQILKAIVADYPEYQDMAAVKNNLKQVQREMSRN